MTLKVDETAMDGNVAGDGWVKQKGLMEKAGWQHDRASQGNPTLSILRYTETGGDASVAIEGTYSLTASLANIPCAVYDTPGRFERKYGSIYEAGDKEFILYPTVDGVSIQIQPTDIISYDGDQYRAVGGTVEYDSSTGRCSALLRLERPD